MNSTRPIALIILDGFGISSDPQSIITPQTMPFFFEQLQRHPHTQLLASGSAVGLPPGTPGNSAVGHLTIGAGEIIPAPLTQWFELISTNTLVTDPIFIELTHILSRSNGKLHLIGILSDGNVHGSILQAQALLLAAHAHRIPTMVHAILDGRDTPPKSAAHYLDALDTTLHTTGAQLGSIHGRFYAMDRNNNMERTMRSVDALSAIGPHIDSWQEHLAAQYAKGHADEYVEPAFFPGHSIAAGDGLIFYNVRTDRMRQLVNCFRTNLNIAYIATGAPYDPLGTTDWQLPYFVTTPTPKNTLMAQLGALHKKSFVCAEYEKSAHVTYFFNGGTANLQAGETRIIVPSLSPYQWTETPALSTPEIVRTVLHTIQNTQYDFLLINLANGDMLGHTGNKESARLGLGIIDDALRDLVHALVDEQGGTVMITSDHGNIECVSAEHHAHTTNPVPFVAISKQPVPAVTSVTQLSEIRDYILELVKYQQYAAMQKF